MQKGKLTVIQKESSFCHTKRAISLLYEKVTSLSYKKSHILSYKKGHLCHTNRAISLIQKVNIYVIQRAISLSYKHDNLSVIQKRYNSLLSTHMALSTHGLIHAWPYPYMALSIHMILFIIHI